MWKFDKERISISYTVNPIYIYEIPLNRCNSSSEILDWVLQLNEKTWVKNDPKVLIGFLDILEELSFKYYNDNLQGVVCPFGKSLIINWSEEIIS